MVVLVVIVAQEDAPTLIAWARHFARGLGTGVLALHPSEHESERVLEEFEPAEAEQLEDRVMAAIGRAVPSDGRRPEGEQHEEVEAEGEISKGPRLPAPGEVLVVRLRAQDASSALEAEIVARGVKLLILAKHRKVEGDAADRALERRLYDRARCDTMLLRPGTSSGESFSRVLIPTTGGPNAQRAIELAAAALEESGRVDALYVQRDVGPDSWDVGRRIVERHVVSAVGSSREQVRPVCVVNDSFPAGLEGAVTASQDLVLVGAQGTRQMRRALFSIVPEKLLALPDGPAVGVLRRSIPLRTRFHRRLRERLEEFVPQLDRGARIELVERIQSSSQWEFDFVALVALSTLIAGMGLVQDSGAVVIGAMLVAPLMTPLVGSGLALVQGNVALIRQSAHSVGLGFLLAFGLGAFLGFFVAGDTPTGEMLARGSPNSIDLLIAFVSGVAAAYASARTDLLGALPGVAIAAALVPPVATSGLALAMGHGSLALGAALLFLTNILAIHLGAALSLWAVGIRAHHAHGREKAWRTRLSGAVLAASAAVALANAGLFTRTLDLVPRRLEDELRARVELEEGARLVRCERVQGGELVVVEVRASESPAEQLGEALAELVSEHLGDEVHLRYALVLEQEY